MTEAEQRLAKEIRAQIAKLEAALSALHIKAFLRRM